MKREFAVPIVTVIIVIVLITGFLSTQWTAPNDKAPDAYVGVAYCGNTVADGKALIDKVKGYSNLFVLQSGVLQRDFESVNELGDYAISKGMYFLPYFGVFIQDTFTVWLEEAKQRWGDHLLGVYYSDEPGGKMLDDYVEFTDLNTGNSITKTRYGDIFVQQTDGVMINYKFDGPIHLYQPSSGSDVNDEAFFYPNGTVEIVKEASNGFSYQTYDQLEEIRPFKTLNETAQRFYDRDTNIAYLKNMTAVFTSDYGLHWFDYCAGFDVVLGQIGWNMFFDQQMALLRGAAELQNKEWGVVITWRYQTPPYLDNKTTIYNQLQTAYECGAKYFVVFDYYDPEDDNPYGTMQEEHFQAVELFWKNVVNYPNVVQGSVKADAVVILPANYGYGGRWMEDHIWGIFAPDNQTRQIWNTMQSALQEHGLQTDIVYADSRFPLIHQYKNIYNCNEFS